MFIGRLLLSYYWKLCENMSTSSEHLNEVMNPISIGGDGGDAMSLKQILLRDAELFPKRNLDQNYLPRNVDVLSYLYFLKSESQLYHKRIDSFYTPAIYKIFEIWKKTDIPTISYSGARKKLDSLFTKYTSIKRNIKKHVDDVDWTADVFFLSNLFNATKCNCISKIKSKFEANNFQCECVNQRDLSHYQYAFLIDQIAERSFQIEIWFEEVVETCRTTTAIQEDMANISLSPVASSAAAPSLPPTTCSNVFRNRLEMKKVKDDKKVCSDSDLEYMPGPGYIRKLIPKSINLPQSINGLDFDGICLEAMQNNTSFRQTSGIINRTLEMIGAITSQERGLVVTPSHLQYKFKKFGQQIVKKQTTMNRKILCFFFDGFSAKNLMNKTVDGVTIIERSIKYENVVLVEQPDNKYLGFVSTTESDSQTIFKNIVEFFTVNNIDLSELVALGCDGATTNVGVNNGIIVKFETLLGRALHRIICLIHLLELILKALITASFGPTYAPNKYVDTIYNDLTECEKKNVTKFEAIQLGNMPQPLVDENGYGSFDWSRTTNDQKVLLDLSQAVSTGCLSDNLARRQLGPLTEVRWTNFASRFLRLYMSTEFPSFRLRCMVNFIQKVYVPVLFYIKCYPEWTDGPRHIYRILSFASALNCEHFKVIRDRLLYNSYFLHSENVLLAMITDQNKVIRQKAYKTILSVRQRDVELNKNNNNIKAVPGSVRVFTKPSKIMFQHSDEMKKNDTRGTEHYSDLINWDEINSIYEPPATMHLSEEEISYYMNSDHDIIKTAPLPCHAQATEFHVQIVKGIVTKYVGHSTQDEHVRAKILSRTLNQKFKQNQRKSDYKTYKTESEEI